MKETFIKDIQLNTQTELYCWISNKRVCKNHVFFDVYDSTGTCKCVANIKINNFEELKKINRESCVLFYGQYQKFKNQKEFAITHWKLIASSTLKISPYPNEPKFNVLDPKHGENVISHPTFYIRNKKLANIFYIKSVFKRQLQNYF